MTFNRLFFLTTFPSLLNPSHSGEQPHGPRTEGRSGRLDVQSPLPGYEANATVGISSAEVTLILLPSRRASFCSVCNSGEDVTMTSVSSEVDERQKHRKAGFTAAHAEERSNCIIYQSNGESAVSSAHLTFEAQGDLSRCTHSNGNRGDQRSAQERHSTRERIRTASRSWGHPGITNR